MESLQLGKCDRNGGSSGVAEKPNIAIRFQSRARIHPGSLYDLRLSCFTRDGLEPEADALNVYCQNMYRCHIGLMGATPWRHLPSFTLHTPAIPLARPPTRTKSQFTDPLGNWFSCSP